MLYNVYQHEIESYMMHTKACHQNDQTKLKIKLPLANNSFKRPIYRAFTSLLLSTEQNQGNSNSI